MAILFPAYKDKIIGTQGGNCYMRRNKLNYNFILKVTKYKIIPAEKCFVLLHVRERKRGGERERERERNYSNYTPFFEEIN